MKAMLKLDELWKSSEPAFVIFHAGWCPCCRRMIPIWEEIEKRYGDRLKQKKFDIDVPANDDLVEYYKINVVPTMMLFRKGEQIWRHSGEITGKEICGIIDGYK